MIAANSGANALNPIAKAMTKASVVAIDSVMPREKISCFITFMPQETELLTR